MSSSKSPVFVFWNSTIGLKIVMAASGLFLVLFVLGHMVGNLQIFLGPETYNAYAHFMQHGTGELLWVVRFGLLALIILHIASSVRLNQRNAAARSKTYLSQEMQATNMNARYMLLSGITILLYIVYHLLHFTVRAVNDYMPSTPFHGHADVYSFFIRSFQNPAIALVYIAANVMLASHLSHATTSIFRTLGLNTGKYRSTFEKIGPAVGFIVLVGNVAMPLACLLRVLSPVQ